MNREMTVKQLSSYLKNVFDDEELLHDVTLTGEIFEVSYSEKHTYLTLVEGDVSIRCMHFSARDRLEKGMRVALRGSVRFYDKRTSVSFCYSEFFTSGDGEKSLAYAALKARLKEAGYFENRPQLPKYVLSVAVVTSRDGAAVRDFIRVVRDGSGLVNILPVPVKVQGEGAAEGIVAALEKLQNSPVDAIVICRGGGSDEDLDCFNNEALAVAVAESKVPIVSAVGHEVDNTLCDYCAGTRAGTPSIAGQIIAARARLLESDLTELTVRMKRALYGAYFKTRARLELSGKRLTKAVTECEAKARNAVTDGIISAFHALDKKSDIKAHTLAQCVQRLRFAVRADYEKKRTRYEKLTAVLNALEPSKLRARYAEVFKDGAAVRSVKKLKDGDNIIVSFADGSIYATVTRTTIEDNL